MLATPIHHDRQLERAAQAAAHEHRYALPAGFDPSAVTAVPARQAPSARLAAPAATGVAAHSAGEVAPHVRLEPTGAPAVQGSAPCAVRLAPSDCDPHELAIESEMPDASGHPGLRLSSMLVVPAAGIVGGAYVAVPLALFTADFASRWSFVAVTSTAAVAAVFGAVLRVLRSTAPLATGTAARQPGELVALLQRDAA